MTFTHECQFAFLLFTAPVISFEMSEAWRNNGKLLFGRFLVPVAREQFGATPCPVWPCFHTTLLRVERDGMEMGLIGGTVGAPFAVLVAEQLIASGCRHIIGYSSSGAISDHLALPCLVVPGRALREL